MAVDTHCNASVVFMPKGWKVYGRGSGGGGVRGAEVAGHQTRARWPTAGASMARTSADLKLAWLSD